MNGRIDTGIPVQYGELLCQGTYSNSFNLNICTRAFKSAVPHEHQSKIAFRNFAGLDRVSSAAPVHVAEQERTNFTSDDVRSIFNVGRWMCILGKMLCHRT